MLHIHSVHAIPALNLIVSQVEHLIFDVLDKWIGSPELYQLNWIYTVLGMLFATKNRDRQGDDLLIRIDLTQARSNGIFKVIFM